MKHIANESFCNVDKIIIKPISTEKEYLSTVELIENLIDADLIEDEAKRMKALDILEALTVLAVEYEKKHEPIEKLEPLEAIKQRLEMLNLSQKDVAQYFG